MAMISYLIHFIYSLPLLWCYKIYDKLVYWYFYQCNLFNGWGIHLYVGRFGAGKTSSLVHDAYKLCVKFPQLTVLTNIKLQNFPKYTKILPLKTSADILAAPPDTLVIIDEIGTIFNSRDFSQGKEAVPKVLFQHLCQCRKRRIMIFGTVQRFNLLDKQIRDITADVTVSQASGSFPFVRRIKLYRYDIDEYEMYQSNRSYQPVCESRRMYIQRNRDRLLYDTSELVDNMLKDEYISDEEILASRGENTGVFAVLDKKQQKALRKRPRR